MSLENKGDGDGDGAIERYNCRYRHLPYLRRNIRQSIYALTTMGATMSSIAGSSPLKAIGDRLWAADEVDEEEEDPRPAKRRKTSNAITQPGSNPLQSRFPSESPRRKPFGQVTNGSRTVAQARLGLAAKLQAVEPSAFYGCAASLDDTSTKRLGRGYHAKEHLPIRGIDSVLPSSPVEFKRALRLEVVGIELKPQIAEESIRFMGNRIGPIESKCRCTVAIFCRDDSREFHNPGSFEVYRKSKTCVLRTSLAADGEVTRELDSLEPFLISAEELCINRKERGPLGGQHCTFELADKYDAMAFLEPVGSQKDWPPFDIPFEHKIDGAVATPGVVSQLVSTREADKSYLQLFCNIPGLLFPDKQNRTAELKLMYGKDKEGVPYCLRLSTKWSLPSCLMSMKTPKSDSPRLVTPRKSITEISQSPSRARGEDPAADTPSRAKRHRTDIPTYNLKALTYGNAKAPKGPRLKRAGWSSSSGESNTAIVIYSFGKSDAFDYGIKPTTTVWGLACPFCSYDHTYLDDLRLHLHTNHCNFKFTLESTDSAKAKFFIELAKSRLPPNSILDQGALTKRTFHLGKPQSLFNLERFLNGDNSWTKARHGPLHNQWPGHLVDLNESSSSPSLYGSRDSSPNTSHTDGPSVDIDHSTKLPLDQRRFQAPTTKHSKPLYDTVSKRVLVAREEIPGSDDETDEGWLHQKHRDIILDFTDVSADEKDYILRWNPFIIEAHLTREDQLQPAVKHFVESHVNWFLERPSRIVELGKQLDNFVTRGVVTNELLTSTMDRLRKAEKELRMDVEMPTAERQPHLQKSRGMLDCVCGDVTTVGPDHVVCRGPKCKNRNFHSRCASRGGRPVQGRWLCDDCDS